MFKVNKLRFGRRTPLFFSFFTWMVAGFDLVQISLLLPEIEHFFFPSDNPVTSILAVYATFSITLFSRLVGGLTLGYLANKLGIYIITRYALLLLPLIFLFSGLVLPNVYSSLFQGYSNFIVVPVLFIISRIAIGFLIGGIWPNIAIFGIEEYFRYKEKKLTDCEFNDNKSKAKSSDPPKHIAYLDQEKRLNYDGLEEYNKVIKNHSLVSALLQSGFHFGILIELLIIFLLRYLISSNNYLFDNLRYLNIHDNNYLFVMTSLIGFLLGFVAFLLWFFWDRTYNKYTGSNNGSVEGQVKKAKVLTRFKQEYWLRSKQTDHDDFYSGSLYVNKDENGLKELLTHRKHRNSLISIFFIVSGLFYMYYSTVIVIPEIYYRNNIDNHQKTVFLFFISAIIGHISPALFHKLYEKMTHNSKEKKPSYIKIIKVLSILILIIGIGLSVLFYTLPEILNSHPDFLFWLHIVIIILANSGWAFMISIMASWFPKQIRLLAASIAYNGGLAISFASPFFIMDLQFQSHQNYFTYIALSLGALSMLYGSSKLSSSYMENKSEYDPSLQGAEIRYPKDWCWDKCDEKGSEYCLSYRVQDNKYQKYIVLSVSETFINQDEELTIKNLKDKIENYFNLEGEKPKIEFLHESKTSIVSVIANQYEFVSRTNRYDRYIVYVIKKYSYHYLLFCYLDSNKSKEVIKIVDNFNIKLRFTEKV